MVYITSLLGFPCSQSWDGCECNWFCAYACKLASSLCVCLLYFTTHILLPPSFTSCHEHLYLSPIENHCIHYLSNKCTGWVAMTKYSVKRLQAWIPLQENHLTILRIETRNNHLSTSSSPDSEGEECWGFVVSIHLELSEASGMALDRLTHFTFHRVELHGSNNTVLLSNRRV